ncbi:MAG: DNA-directed RNA polymerase specialized sigma24 family protein [Pirellulaceae bacterium]|jgi:DNA-directed RNA polymerase specialized sigma24 family protein
MSIENSITHWVEQLKAGDDTAVHPLWERFFTRLTAIARQGLKGQSLPMADEEDIALSAFHSLCSGLRDGRFPELQSRESLWRLLLVITTRKVADQFAFDRRSKRDSNRIARPDEGADEDDLVRQLVSREPTPEMVAQVAEQIAKLMESLVHEDLQSIALRKMEGFKNVEIAQELDRSVATVERKLRTIRSIWDQVE